MKRSFRLSDSRPNPERDVSDEIGFHLDMRMKEFLEQGMSPEDARKAASASFGDVAAGARGLRSSAMRSGSGGSAGRRRFSRSACCSAAIVIVVALGATYLPARRATRVDPTTALRTD